jgi:subtilisin-like proprotein convertase family protein
MASGAAPFLAEDFSNDPVANNRFVPLTFATESSFTYDPVNQNLTAVLDVDHDVAYYLSAPFTPVTGNDDVSFSFNFRVNGFDLVVLPTAFIGLVTTNHVATTIGGGLTMVLSSSNGFPIANAAVDQGPANFGGEAIPLALSTDYLAVGRYTASNGQFSVEIYGGTYFANFIGRSVAFGTNLAGLSVDRFGLQNGGSRSFDFTNGSITVVIDNIFMPAHPPANLSITDVAIDEGDSGFTNVVFTVTLSSPSVQTVRVDFATSDLTATAGADYLAQSGTLVFAPGVTSRTISVPVAGDVLAEPDEAFKIVLNNPVNANLVVTEALCAIRDNDHSLISISDAVVAEFPGGLTNAVFLVSLSTSNSRPVTVDFTTADGTALAGSDYVGTNGTLTIPPGATRTSILVAVLDEARDETNETFLVSISNPNPINATLAKSEAVGTIVDSSPPPTVFFDGLATVPEGNDGVTHVVIAIYMSGISDLPVVVSYATSNDTATAGSDYQGTNGTVTFSPGQTEVDIVVDVFGDRVYEPAETFFVQLTSAQNAVLGTSSELVLIENDDPLPAIDVLDTGVTEGDNGTTDAVFEFRLSNPSTEMVTVNFATTNGTATAGDDFVSTNGVLSFAPGVTNLSIVVPVVGDQVNEVNETFGLRLDSPVNAVLARSQAICVITNDDFIYIAIDDAFVREGDGGSTNAVFVVTLSGPAAQQVAVTYVTFDATATSGIDYIPGSGVLTFPSGVMTQYITVPVLGDIVDEPDEAFYVILTGMTNALFSRQVGTGWILNDDPPAISIDGASLNEGAGGVRPFVFPLTLSSSSTNVVTVNFSTSDGTATAGTDYYATNGTVTFPAGTVTNSIVVTVLGDTLYEADEYFFLNLNQPHYATLMTNQVVGIIRNDELAPVLHLPPIVIIEGTCTNIQITLSETSGLPVVVTYCLTNLPANAYLVCPSSGCTATVPTNVSPSCRSVCCTLTIPPGVLSTNIQLCVEDNGIDETNIIGRLGIIVDGGQGQDVEIKIIDSDPPSILAQNAGLVEGNSVETNLCFTLRLTTPHDTNVWVNFLTVDGTAQAGLDYRATNGTVLFSPGVTTQFVCVPVIGDILFEADETFFLRLTNAVNGVLANPLVTGVITNDDALPQLTINDVTVIEGNSGTNLAVFTVSVLSPSSLTITVGFATVDDTASNGSDYLSTSGTLQFAPGVTSRTVTVPVLGDTADEPNETFFVRLNNPANATLARTNGIGTILDDDPPEIRAFDASVIEGNAGTTSLVFTVALLTPHTQTVTVAFLTKDGTARAGSDYLAASGVLAFAPGTQTQTVALTIFGDTLTELNETLFLCLTNATNGTIVDAIGEGQILDDDAPCIQIGNVTVKERTTGTTNAVFVVTLDKASTLDLSVNYSSSNGTATAGADYVGQSGTLIFSNGVTTQFVTITVNSDLEVEPNETFFVNLFGAINGKLCGDPGRGTILDGTVAPVLTVGSASVIEGAAGTTTNLVFTATLSRASPQTVSVDISTFDGTATAGSDYIATNRTVTFLPGITATNFAITVLGDSILEPNESLFVLLNNSPLAVLATNVVLGTIIDDDPPPTVFISNVTVTEPDLGTTNAVFNLWLSSPSSFPACLDYATMNGTATAGSDYIATNGTVCFPPGVTNAVIVVRVLGDFETEPNETFFVNLSNPLTALLNTNRATGTILDDDGISVRIFPATAIEGNPAHFVLTLSKPPSSPRSVEFRTQDGTAVSPVDYLGTNVVVQFPAGVTNQFVDVMTLNDTEDEPAETFLALLSNPDHLDIATSQALGTILDDDPPCISINDILVIDVGSNSLVGTFIVSLSSTSSFPISMRFATTNGTALGGSDFEPGSGLLVIPPGATNGSITVNVLPNFQDETNEFFYVILSNPTNATLCKPAGVCTIVTVFTNIPPLVVLNPPQTPCMTAPASLTLTATASDPDGIILSVDFLANGVRLKRVLASPWEYAWANVASGDYMLSAVATDNLGASTTSAPVHFAASLPAGLSIDDVSVVEGNSSTSAVFTVSLASPSCRTVSVDVATADVTAVAGIDYLSVTTNLVFLPGVTQRSVSVPIIGDLVIEPDETFRVLLSNATNATLIRTPGTGTIINDDTNEPPTVIIVSPTNNAVFFVPPGLVPIFADAQDPDGYVQWVDFFVGGTFIGRSTNSPFNVSWTSSVVQTNILTAIATDNAGARGTSAPVRVILRSCSGLLTATPMPDQTACACESVTFSTTVTSPQPASFAWRLNNRLIPGETNSFLVLRSLTSEYAGRYSVEIRTPCASLTNSAMLTILGENMPNPLVLANPSGIIINDVGPATPNPSYINVECVPGPIKKITVTVTNLSHDFFGDIDMLLLSPSGNAVPLMSDVGFDSSLNHLTLTFDDAAPNALPSAGDFASGTYKPTDYTIGDEDHYGCTTPTTVFTNQLAGLIGLNPNGLWALCVVDDETQDGGSITGGWSLKVFWDDLVPRLSVPVMPGDGTVHLTLTGQAGRTHVIEGSTDFQHWFPVSTNTMVGTVMPITLPEPPADFCRFYRAIRCPRIDIFQPR